MSARKSSKSGNKSLYNDTPASPGRANLSALGDSELDPGIHEGFNIAYDREVHVQICSDDGGSKPKAWEAIRIRCLVMGEGKPERLRIELTSETDLFFNYNCSMNEEQFNDYAERQKLRVSYAEYASVICRMCNDCIREPNNYIAVFVLSEDGRSGRLDFIQNYDYKLVELLSVNFSQSSAERVRESIVFRYNTMKKRLHSMAQRLEQTNHLVKIKSPSVMLDLQRLGVNDRVPSNVAGRGNSSISSANLNASAPARSSPVKKLF